MLPDPDEERGYIVQLADFYQVHYLCSFDATPLTFSRKSHIEVGKAAAEVVRGCRSFVDAQKWAMARRFREAIDLTSVVADDPLNWGNYGYSP
ncbi:hypothetical protein V496_07713 [Pseudogymnoascus sp. VKM F-4515 (FW-2607)]|nr:hypothetical protein V496_07713 [Pseudogymnoascus sp. VKM F-4515 (FW-2607)]KFY78867.1 hypothetical protein V498_09036 [Pseudogymnoascus sp. VKM F-4517 (FW-2822)]